MRTCRNQKNGCKFCDSEILGHFKRSSVGRGDFKKHLVFLNIGGKKKAWQVRFYCVYGDSAEGCAADNVGSTFQRWDRIQVM